MVLTYEIRELEGKGVGCFALQDISCGTKIIEEIPVLHLQKGSKDIMSAFGALTLHQQIEWLSLHGTKDHQQSLYSAQQSTPGFSILQQVRQRISELELLTMNEDAFVIAYMRNPEAVDAALYRMHEAKSEALLELTAKVEDIFHTNCFGMSATDPGQPHSGGSILNLQISRINHSCIPNAEFVWNPSTTTSRAHATKDIPAGQEILISYLDAYLNRSDRAVKLRQWGFECDCEACDMSTEFGRASDRRRTELKQLHKHVSKHLKEPDASPFHNYREFLQATSRILDLLDEEGLVGFDAIHLQRAIRL